MDNQTYEWTQKQLIELCKDAIVSPLDLPGFLERIRQAEAAGPVMDPTAWQKNGKLLLAIKGVAEAYLHFQNRAEELRNAMLSLKEEKQ